MSRWLLLFTFSPVQSFISQGRKTQDVYSGSYILSYLCGVVLEKAKTDFHAEIIFPSLANESRPNRFLAIIECNRESLKNVGQKLEVTLREEFLSMGSQILKSLSCDGNGLTEAFKNQLSSYLQVYWAFEEIEEDNYATAYRKIEAKLGMVKSIRPFSQLAETEGRKCALTGEHNVLVYRGSKKAYVESPAVRIPVTNNVPLKFLKDGENLGAVGALKRFAELYFSAEGLASFQPDFPSTAEVALFDAFEKLKEKDKVLIDRIKMRPNFDYQGVYDRNNNKPLSDDLSDEQKKAVDLLTNRIRNNNISICPYYAVLLFDGDNMGKVLFGEQLKDGVVLKEFHAELTKVLGSFAEDTHKIVKEPVGEVVYAGGEDFLAFINLHYLFDVLTNLRTRFDSINLDSYMKKKLTFSAGVAVAHYKTPLVEVLKWARKMEKEAKEVDKVKNALGIAVIKHSGEIEKAVYRWQAEETDMWITQPMQRMMELLNDSFSDTFIRSLNREFRKLLDHDGRIICDSVLSAFKPQKVAFEESLVAAEIKRLIIRSCKLSGSDVNKKSAVNELHDILMYFFKERLLDVNNFLSILNIVSFIERKVNI